MKNSFFSNILFEIKDIDNNLFIELYDTYHFRLLARNNDLTPVVLYKDSDDNGYPNGSIDIKDLLETEKIIKNKFPKATLELTSYIY